MHKAIVVMHDKEYVGDVTGFGLCVYLDNSGWRIGHLASASPFVPEKSQNHDSAVQAMFEMGHVCGLNRSISRKDFCSDPRNSLLMQCARSIARAYGMRP